MNIEGGLLSKVIETGQFSPLMEAHIKEDFFANEEHRGVFKWMLDFWERYDQKAPSRDALGLEFPSYQMVDTPEPLQYYIDELFRQHRYGRVHETIERAVTPMRQGDPDAALGILAASVEEIYHDMPLLTDTDLTETTTERLEFYASLRNLDGMSGIPTGFPTMDMVTSGLQKEQLITLIGISKAGKSTVLMCMNIAAHTAGYRPLFVTFEMSNTEQSARHDALRAGISYKRLMTGKLRPQEKERLNKMMRELEAMPAMLFIHDPGSATTVSSLAAKIAQHKPDVVFVDGAYLMECDDPKLDPTTPQGLTTITRSMKRLAQRSQIPIVQTTQALKWKYSAKRGLDLGSIGYTSSFGQDSDIIFGVEQPPDKEDELLLRIVAARNTARKAVRLDWDWDHGNITEIDEPFEEEDDEDSLYEQS